MATTKNLSDLSKAHLISQNPFFSASAHPGSSIFMNTGVNPFGLPGMNGLPMGFLTNPNYFTSHDPKLNNDSMYSSFNPLRDDSLSHLQSISDHDKSSDEKDIDVSVHSRDSEDEEKGSGYRNQKKPIPNEQKDGKYFERRRRNNLAAKKSRDARKTREDQLATRVAHLEKENAIFRAQVAILREEMSVLQLYLCQKANGGLPTDN